MKDPVVTEHGHCFDRLWIEAVIRSGQPCPLTRLPFKTGVLSPDSRLKEAIDSHPAAKEEASQALYEGPARTADTVQPGAGEAAAGRSYVPRHEDRLTRSDALRPNDSTMRSFLLGNVAGEAHKSLSRGNLRQKIVTSRQRLQELEAAGASPHTRAKVAGRIQRVKTQLAFANASSPVTSTVDFVLGHYTAKDNDIYNWHGVGLMGLALWPATALTCNCPIPGLAAQSASLVGAGIKGLVRLSAQGPAHVARVAAERSYLRDNR